MLAILAIVFFASLGLVLAGDALQVVFSLIHVISALLIIPAIIYAVILTSRAKRAKVPADLPKNPKNFVTMESEYYQAMRFMDLESERPYAVGETRHRNHFGHLDAFNGEKWVPASEFEPVPGTYECVKTKSGFCWTLPLRIENCQIDSLFDAEGLFLNHILTVNGVHYELSNQGEIMLRGLMGFPEDDERLLHVALNESGIDAAQLAGLMKQIVMPVPGSDVEVLAEIEEGSLYLTRVCFDHWRGRPVLEIWKRGAPDSGNMELVSSNVKKLNDVLEILVRKSDHFAGAMRLGRLCGQDVSEIVETYAQRKRLDDLRGLFSQAQETGESIWHDVVLNRYRWTIRLEDSRTAFWSVFLNDSTMAIEKYSLDIETASDSHYEFSYAAEKKLRRALGVPVESLSPTHEILIEHLKTNSWQSLESLAKKFCDQQFHYD